MVMAGHVHWPVQEFGAGSEHEQLFCAGISGFSPRSEATNAQWKKLEVVGSLGAEVDYNHDGGMLATGGLKVGNQHQVPTTPDMKRLKRVRRKTNGFGTKEVGVPWTL